MDWGCCNEPKLQWNFMGDTADLRCEACGESWTPVHLERPIHAVSSNNGTNPLDDGTYQAAWKTLLIRISEKTSWGKNLLRDVMLDCLTNPDPAEHPHREPNTEEIESGAVGVVEIFNGPDNVASDATTVKATDQVTETVEESLAGIYPFPSGAAVGVNDPTDLPF